MFRCILTFSVLYLMSSTSLANFFVSKDILKQSSSELKAVVFLSASCPCSKSHIKHLNALTSEFKNLDVYGVATDSFTDKSAKLIQEYYSPKRFSFPVIKDPSQELIKEYKALKTPHVVLSKRLPDGTYAKLYEGGVTNKRDFKKSKKLFLKENLTAFKKGTSLPFKHGKSLGCYIRRLK